MPWKIDIGGQRFGRLVALSPAHSTPQGVKWNCRCDCGNETAVLAKKLRNGHTVSCGCRRKTVNLRHGHARTGKQTPEFKAWSSMMSRCYYEGTIMWHRYGGRGIKVCDRWRLFENFLEDVGPRPSPKHSLDRINNDGDYEPGNVRWATKIQQDNNRSTSVFYTYKGVTGTIAQVRERLNISLPLSTLLSRHHWKWPVDDLFGAPPRARLGLGRTSKKAADA